MTFNESEIAIIKNEVNILNQNNISDTINNFDYFCDKIKEEVLGIECVLEACKKISDLNDGALFLQQETKAICHEIMDIL